MKLILSKLQSKAHEQIEKRRQHAMIQHDNVRAAYQAQYPELKAYDQSIQQSSAEWIELSFEYAAGTISESDLHQQIEQHRNLIAEYEAFLKQHHIPKAYEFPEFSCSKCSDEGTFMGGMCTCEQAIYQQYLRQYLMREADPLHKLKHFDTLIYSDEVASGAQGQSPREIMKRYQSQFLNQSAKLSDNYMFMGDTGTGKTFFATCMAECAWKNDQPAMFVHAQTLFDDYMGYERMQVRYQVDPVQLHHLTQQKRLYEAVDVLVIDDLGVESGPLDERFKCWLQLFKARKHTNLVTIVTTNLLPKDFVHFYGERLYSKVFEQFKLVRFLGKDLRRIK